MSFGLGRLWTLSRGRWRWMRGRCPACNRELGADPRGRSNAATCAVCVDETQMDLRVWHNYRRSLAGSSLLVDRTSVEGSTPLH